MSNVDPGLLSGMVGINPQHELVTDPMASCDIAVMDARSFPSAAAFETALRKEAELPKLILVDGQEAELALIRSGCARPLDELCRSERTAEELILRLRRVIARVEEIRSLSSLDPLTGVMTRRGFMAVAEALLAAVSPDSPISLVAIDIDDFKKINDDFGHQAADGILRRLGQMLQEDARGVQCIARTGGEEFSILMRGALDQATGLAEYLRREIESEPFDDGIRVTASFGVDMTAEPTSVGDFILGADTCLYRAKAEGRNRVVASDALQKDTGVSGPDADIRDFETRIRVMTERFGQELALRGRRMARRYRVEAEHDSLTGLFNRRYLDNRLPREIDNALAHDRRLSLIMLDLDHFGDVNRTYGYPGGDAVLKSLAGVLKSNTRAVDWVARYGGEEFCVVMPDTPIDEGIAIAERLRAAIKETVSLAFDGREIRSTASMGVVEIDGSGSRIREMVAFIQAASDKVREAKKGGRDRVCPGAPGPASTD